MFHRDEQELLQHAEMRQFASSTEGLRLILSSLRVVSNIQTGAFSSLQSSLGYTYLWVYLLTLLKMQSS